MATGFRVGRFPSGHRSGPSNQFLATDALPFAVTLGSRGAIKSGISGRASGAALLRSTDAPFEAAWGLLSATVTASDDLTSVSLRDSWVLGVETTDSSVCFDLEAVLEDDHPRFYWPPRPGERHSYARLRWCLRGVVHWNEGPNLDHPAVDANDEIDFGHIDVWLQSGDRHMLEGDWGNVVIDRPTQTVEYLD